MNLTTRILGSQAAREERYERIRRGFNRFKQNKLAVIGAGMLAVVVIAALFPATFAPYPEDKDTTHFKQRLEPPSSKHVFGTDDAGRDIFSRVLFGARISLLLSVVVISIAVTLGTIIGMIAGYLGGSQRTLIMRGVDILLAVPPLVMALAITAVLAPTLWNAMFAIALVWWTWYARVVQGEVLSVKEEGFVEASEAMGARWYDIAFREILPNIVSPLTVKATLDMGAVILVGAALAFIGVGAQPPTPSWGLMISQGREYITQQWWIATFPGLAISWTVLGFNLLGDGLRDILDVEVE